MDKKTFQVPAIGCDGCVRTIENELSELEGVITVEGTVDTKMVTVEWQNPADWQQIAALLREIEYPPAE